MMTEDEAKAKWCPFARVTLRNGQGAGNRTMLGDWGGDSDRAIERKASCIGPACMAWRWADEIERRWTGEPPEGEGWRHVAAIGGVAHYARTHKTPHGFCGLAGAPA